MWTATLYFPSEFNFSFDIILLLSESSNDAEIILYAFVKKKDIWNYTIMWHWKKKCIFSHSNNVPHPISYISTKQHFWQRWMLSRFEIKAALLTYFMDKLGDKKRIFVCYVLIEYTIRKNGLVWLFAFFWGMNQLMIGYILYCFICIMWYIKSRCIFMSNVLSKIGLPY